MEKCTAVKKSPRPWEDKRLTRCTTTKRIKIQPHLHRARHHNYQQQKQPTPWVNSLTYPQKGQWQTQNMPWSKRHEKSHHLWKPQGTNIRRNSPCADRSKEVLQSWWQQSFLIQYTFFYLWVVVCLNVLNVWTFSEHLNIFWMFEHFLNILNGAYAYSPVCLL